MKSGRSKRKFRRRRLKISGNVSLFPALLLRRFASFRFPGCGRFSQVAPRLDPLTIYICQELARGRRQALRLPPIPRADFGNKLRRLRSVNISHFSRDKLDDDYVQLGLHRLVNCEDLRPAATFTEGRRRLFKIRIAFQFPRLPALARATAASGASRDAP